MIGYKIDPKGLFFDRPAVAGLMDRKARRVLSRFGAFVRRRSRSSIRKRRKTSRPGQPPSSHLGQLRNIFFVFEPRRQSVVIGPARQNRIGDAPEALEHGGASLVAAGGGDRRRRRRRVVIRARPFMGPAFQAELPGLPAMWADSVK